MSINSIGINFIFLSLISSLCFTSSQSAPTSLFSSNAAILCHPPDPGVHTKSYNWVTPYHWWGGSHNESPVTSDLSSDHCDFVDTSIVGPTASNKDLQTYFCDLLASNASSWNIWFKILLLSDPFFNTSHLPFLSTFPPHLVP